MVKRKTRPRKYRFKRRLKRYRRKYKKKPSKYNEVYPSKQMFNYTAQIIQFPAGGAIRNWAQITVSWVNPVPANQYPGYISPMQSQELTQLRGIFRQWKIQYIKMKAFLPQIFHHETGAGQNAVAGIRNMITWSDDDDANHDINFLGNVLKFSDSKEHPVKGSMIVKKVNIQKWLKKNYPEQVGWRRTNWNYGAAMATSFRLPTVGAQGIGQEYFTLEVEVYSKFREIIT